jgi:hypothetical protein
LHRARECDGNIPTRPRHIADRGSAESRADRVPPGCRRLLPRRHPGDFAGRVRVPSRPVLSRSPA